MSAVRLIDANALLVRIESMNLESKSRHDVMKELGQAPTVTLQPAEGDAISRVWLYQKLQANPASFGHPQFTELIRQAPSLHATPALDVDVDGGVVTAEDVKAGTRFKVGDGFLVVDKLSSEWSLLSEGNKGLICLPNKMVAAMLNVAESVTFPEGHPRNPTKPKEPTLLEAAEAFMREASTRKRVRISDQGDFGQLLEDLRAAIESERKGEGK